MLGLNYYLLFITWILEN